MLRRRIDHEPSPDQATAGRARVDGDFRSRPPDPEAQRRAESLDERQIRAGAGLAGRPQASDPLLAPR